MADFWFAMVIFLSGGALAAISVVAARYLRDIRAARLRLDHLGSRMIETACGPVEYARIGEGDPLLVVHGALGGFDQGLFLARSIDVPNRQIISVSRFGFLRSPVPPDATLDMQADTFAALLDALEIPFAEVFAVSAGSTSAIRFAARHPQRVSALILMGPDAPGETYMALPPRFMSHLMFGNDFVYWAMIHIFGKKMQVATGLVPKGYTLTPEYEALVSKVQTGSLPVSWRIDGWNFETYTCEKEFWASVTPASPYPLSKIETPVLFIMAEDDPISLPANVRAMADQMPNASLYVVPDGGHFLFGHAEEVKAEVARFLGSHKVEPQDTTIRQL
ncbi:MAG: alpha/beta hydrolase [Anaerolineaceae bacterium]|nr:alpha/beta hydrolase [Anaerolineaceae bacterium]